MNGLWAKLAGMILLTTTAGVLYPQLALSQAKSNKSTTAQRARNKRLGADQPHKISKYSGERTTLVLDAEFWMPRHDVDDYGHTTISLLSIEGSVIFKKELDDNFTCLGYNHEGHAFILSSIGEYVSYPATVSVRYISEETPDLVKSKSFNGQYVAGETIPSPDLKFIAFIGHRLEPPKWQLYVLDTTLDTVRLLGKAPDPPPFSKDFLETIKAGFDPNNHQDACDQWQWGWAGKLEPGICKFIAPHVLQVSYGNDTCSYRSKHRILQKWTL